jgi:hypothetical protein
MSENPLSTGYETLGADINKLAGSEEMETAEGVVSQKTPELTLDMDDEDLIALTKKWRKSWETSAVKKEWEEHGNENEKYWLGKQYSGPEVANKRAVVDNVIFESLETYLPQVTRRNPDPMVDLDDDSKDNPDGQAFILKLKEELSLIADKNRLRIKLKRAAQSWAIKLLAVVKYSWDIDRDIPLVKVVRPEKIILDPDATVDEDGYTGERVGEYRKMTASKMLEFLNDPPDGTIGDEAIKKVEKLVDKDDGTELQFIEWWTDEYTCWVLDDKVLWKAKNPHWNYDKTADGQTNVDDYGNETDAQPEENEGRNHFKVPRKPYDFLSVFNLGEQPMDKTSLIGQNLSNQDLINKRNKQITKNGDNMNGGMVVSLARSGLDEAKAKNVAKAIQNGGTVVIPDGAPLEAITRLPSPGLPNDLYNQLNDTRGRMRDIFGTRGSSPGGISSEDTARGKIISRTLDTDRIGGGISEHLEQLADNVYNWMVQLLYVYDDDYAAVPGKESPGVEVSVKEGSLLPKDSTSIANQAIQLAQAGKMSLLDLYKRLEYPNPEELAVNMWLESNSPETLFSKDPRVAQIVQQKQQAAQAAQQAEAQKNAKAPSMSMAYKDLPPEGQVQMAHQAGIDLSPEAVTASAPEAIPGAAPPMNGMMA